MCGSRHPSSKGRQETALGRRKRKPLSSGSSGHGVRPGGAAGGGEERPAQSRVGPQPAPTPPAFPHFMGSNQHPKPRGPHHVPQPTSRTDLCPPGHKPAGRRRRCLRGALRGVTGSGSAVHCDGLPPQLHRWELCIFGASLNHPRASFLRLDNGNTLALTWKGGGEERMGDKEGKTNTCFKTLMINNCFSQPLELQMIR